MQALHYGDKRHYNQWPLNLLVPDLLYKVFVLGGLEIEPQRSRKVKAQLR